MCNRTFILISIMLSSFTCYAADPPQFAGLLNDSTVYSNTWDYPTIPNFGGAYVDPIYGTTTKRVNAMTDCLIDGSHTTECSTRPFYPDYSKQVAWNADGTKYLVKDGNAWYHLYDSATNTDVRRITDATGLSLDHDVRWSNTDPDLIYFVHQLSLKSYNIITRAVTTIHTFSCTDGTLVGDSWKNGDEGNPSFDDRYWAGMCTNYTSGVTTTLAVMVYDKQTDTVIANKTPSEICGGTCGTTYTNKINWVGMSPTGNYVVINWNSGSNYESNYVRGSGTELFSRDLTYSGMLMAGNSHMDVGYDVNGVEVAVMAQADVNTANNESLIYVRKLSDPTQLSTILLPYQFQRSIGYGVGTFYNNSWHVATRISSGNAMGWALFSTWFPYGNTSTGLGWGSNELFAVKIDTTVPSGSTWYRIGRTMSIRNTDYNAEPHAVPNRDFTKILFGSNWNTDGGLVTPYVISLPISGSPTPGICGASNGASLSSTPTTGLCSAGTASAVTGTGPWSWTCAGAGGGSTASCGASLLEIPPAGDASTVASCPVMADFR